MTQRSATPHDQPQAILLGLPGGNTGDDLIRLGCERFLDSTGMSLWSSDGTVETAAAAGQIGPVEAALRKYRGLVFFTGGGNIGIYPDNERMRAAVIAAAPAASGFLVLPQSSRAPEPSLVDPRVTVWARDAASERMLRAAGIRTSLVPDAGLALADAFTRHPTGAGTYLILRSPETCDERVDHDLVLEGDSGDLTHTNSLDDVIARLLPYATVVSDRLHGGLISIMLGKRTGLLPVGYHKIRSYYETWLSHDPGIGFIESQSDLDGFLEGDATPTGDYAGLFRERAHQALDDFLDRL